MHENVKNNLYEILNDNFYCRIVFGEYELHERLNVKYLKVVIMKYFMQQDDNIDYKYIIF